MSDPQFDLNSVKKAASAEFSTIRGVVGVGIEGASTLIVYVLDEATKTRIPAIYKGAKVKTIVTGEIVATQVR